MAKEKYPKHLKVTTGFVIQEYITMPDGRMLCTQQSFVAGEVEYNDMMDNVIEVDTSKELYQPFHMEQPTQISEPDKELAFTCPTCGDNRLECVMDGSHTCIVTRLNKDGDFDYGPYESNADVDRWQCVNCGYVLQNDDENIINNEDVVEWIKENC